MGSNINEKIKAVGGGATSLKGNQISLPDSVRIGSHHYRVLFPYHFSEATDFMGQIDYGLLEIRITDVDLSGNQRPPSKILETFWHEVVHAIDHEYLSNKVMDKLGEDTIKILARAHLQVLHDNFLVIIPSSLVETRNKPEEPEESGNTDDGIQAELFKNTGHATETDMAFMAAWNEAHFKQEAEQKMPKS